MSTPSSRDTRKGRQSLALWIGGGIGVLVVVIVLLVTLAAGGGSGSDVPNSNGSGGPTAQTAPTGSVPEALTAPLPEGDYGPFCTEFESQIDLKGSYTTPQQLVAAMDRIDIGRLEAVAPAGVKADLQYLEAHRSEFRALLDQVEHLQDIAAGDLPDGFADATITISRIVTEKCQR
jgi:hypothetical protein